MDLRGGSVLGRSFEAIAWYLCSKSVIVGGGAVEVTAPRVAVKKRA